MLHCTNVYILKSTGLFSRNTNRTEIGTFWGGKIIEFDKLQYVVRTTISPILKHLNISPQKGNDIETLEYFPAKRQWYWNTWIFPQKRQCYWNTWIFPKKKAMILKHMNISPKKAMILKHLNISPKKAMILKHLNISQKRQWYRDLRTALVLTNEVLAAARAQKKFVFGHQSGQLFHKPQFQNGFDKCISYIYSVEFFVEFFSKKSYEDFTIIRGQWWCWWCRWSPVETAVMRKVSQSATFTTGETNIASAAVTIVNMGMKKTPFCGCFYP